MDLSFLDAQEGPPDVWLSGSVYRRCTNSKCNASEKKMGVRFKECSACKTTTVFKTLYCSRECQKADWPKHKLQCQNIAQLSEAIVPVSKQRNKYALILDRWKLAQHGQLVWVTREAFKSVPRAARKDAILQLVFEDNGPHGEYMAPTKMLFISRDEFRELMILRPGVDRNSLQLPEHRPDSYSVSMCYRGFSNLFQYLKEEVDADGALGPLPSIPQWPWLLVMAATLTQHPMGFISKRFKWEIRLKGWVMLGFNEEYSKLANFSFEEGWIATENNYRLFEEAIKRVDAMQERTPSPEGDEAGSQSQRPDYLSPIRELLLSALQNQPPDVVDTIMPLL